MLVELCWEAGDSREEGIHDKADCFSNKLSRFKSRQRLVSLNIDAGIVTGRVGLAVTGIKGNYN